MFDALESLAARMRHWLWLAVLLPGMALAGDPGRLEADAEFLLGAWANDCALGGARIFLRDGALRQQGLLQLVNKDGSAAIPITLLAATRDGVGLSLESRTRLDGTIASSRFLARVVSEAQIDVKSMTLCRGKRCQTTRLNLPWTRCTSDG